MQQPSDFAGTYSHIGWSGNCNSGGTRETCRRFRQFKCESTEYGEYCRNTHFRRGRVGTPPMTRSSGIVTLFAVQPPPRRGPSSFLVSLLVHGVAFVLLLFGLRHAPR